VINAIFKYCLAVALEKTGVQLHAACVMSNHHHLVVTDPRGALPDFLRELHRLTAKAINALQGKRENLWAAEPCSVVRLVTDEDIEDKIAYVAANPVKAGLVSQTDRWPGFSVWGERVLRVAQPKSYFRRSGSACPIDARLEVTRPPSRDRSRRAAGDVWRARVVRAIARRVASANRAARQSARGPIVGQTMAPIDRRPTTKEPLGRIRPTFSAMRRAVRDTLRLAERQFRRAYRRALEWWRSGRDGVVFPAGTWGMRSVPVVAIDPPPS
jgi:REP element-mobilizing transposase RayT